MFRFFAFLFLAVFFSFPVYGQETAALILNSADHILLEEGMIDLPVEIKNTSTETLQLQLKVILPEGLQMLSTNPLTLHVPAQKSRFAALKFQANLNQSLQGKVMDLLLINAQGEIVRKQSIRLEVKEKRSVRLVNQTEPQLLGKTVDSIAVRLRVVNDGTTAESVKLIFSSPNRLGNREFKSMEVYMPAFTDTLLSYAIRVEPYMISLPQYMVHVAGLYASNDVFQNISIVFNNISSTRNFTQIFESNGSPSALTGNQFNINIRNLGMDNPSYFLTAVGAYALSHDQKLDFNLYAYQAGDLKLRPAINNTYLNYQKNNSGITIGNIQESTDVLLNGRGIKVYAVDSLKENGLTLGILDKSYNLLGDNFGLPYSSPGISIYAQGFLGDGNPEKRIYKGLLYYDYSNYDRTESLLYHNSFGLIKQKYAKTLQIQPEFGIGLMRPLDGLSSSDMDFKASMSAGLKATATFLKFNFNSENYISSSYYPGLRRGAMQFNQRLSRRFGNQSLSLGYSYYDYDPKYFGIMSNLSNYFMNSRAEVFYTIPLNQMVSWSINPAFQQEKGRYISTGIEEGLQGLTSYRLSNAINWRSRNFQHNIYLSLEEGLNKLSYQDKLEFLFRSNLSYGYQNFTLSGSYQRGTFMLAEALSSRMLNRGEVYRFTLTPSYNQTFFDRKLYTNLGLSYNLSNYSGAIYQSAVDLQYQVLKKTRLTGNFQYYYLTNQTYATNYASFQLGIRQYLPDSFEKDQVKRGRLNFFCFYDENNNNIYDKGEKLAENYGFLVENILFLTDHEGKANYRNVPYGSYLISFPKKDGWQAKSIQQQVRSHSELVSVALQRVQEISGRIEMIFNEQFDEDANTNLGGYAISIRDSYGQVQQTFSDEEGKYQFSVPAGLYTIFLDEASFPPYIYTEAASIWVEVQQGKPTQIPHLRLQIRAKEVEIKRFGRPK